MKILILILSMALLSAVSDVYIYRRVVRRRLGRCGRRAWIWGCLVLDLLVVGVLLLLRYGSWEGPMGLAMWLLAIFFAHVVPNAIYMIFSLPGTLGGRRFFHRLGAGLGIAMLALMLWGMSFGRTWIRVEQVEITSDQLPETFDGLRVVQFSDLHAGTLQGRERFIGRLVERIDALQPDVVIQSGDIVNHDARELDAAAMAILSQIDATHGVFAALGNHDLGFYMHDGGALTPEQSIAQLIDKQRGMGWQLLIDRTAYIYKGIDSLAITALNYPAGDRMLNHLREAGAGTDLRTAYADVPAGIFDLTIAHTPNLWDEIRATGKADLTLSGHVHAMQTKLFGWSPAQWMYERWSGMYEADNQRLYINDGLGCVMYPMRIGARPELTLFILRRP